MLFIRNERCIRELDVAAYDRCFGIMCTKNEFIEIGYSFGVTALKWQRRDVV